MENFNLNHMKTITHISPYGEYQVAVSFAKFTNGQTAISFIDVEDGMAFCKATVSIPETLSENEVAVKNWSENEGVLDTLVNNNIVKKPHRYVSSGHVSIPICELI